MKDDTISMRRFISFVMIIMLIISGLLLISTYSTGTVYANLNANIEAYLQWKDDAKSLQRGSDYLTEQVRCFVVTGNRVYLDNYFEEANVTRTRDKAVESVKSVTGDSEAYQSLVSSMGESVDLMDREYYAMRLAVSAFGYDLSEYPQEVRDVALSAEDQSATPLEQRETARMMVFDEIYHEKKAAITSGIQSCLNTLDMQMDAEQASAQNSMKKTLLLERIMIVGSIAAFCGAFLMILFLAVSPLLKSASYIQKDQALPIEGVMEFRFLANEYNIMHAMNIDQKKELVYETTHDKLTGVFNRNGFDSIRQSVDWDSSALILLDLDRFRAINETHGYDTGDRVLKRAAGVIRSTFRPQDFVCRIDGDEFAVILVQTNQSGSGWIMEKVNGINAELGSPEGDIPAIQASCGVGFGSLIPGFDSLFHETDAAMYRVKQNGGAGCGLVDPESPDAPGASEQ